MVRRSGVQGSSPASTIKAVNSQIENSSTSSQSVSGAIDLIPHPYTTTSDSPSAVKSTATPPLEKRALSKSSATASEPTTDVPAFSLSASSLPIAVESLAGDQLEKGALNKSSATASEPTTDVPAFSLSASSLPIAVESLAEVQLERGALDKSSATASEFEPTTILSASSLPVAVESPHEPPLETGALDKSPAFASESAGRHFNRENASGAASTSGGEDESVALRHDIPATHGIEAVVQEGAKHPTDSYNNDHVADHNQWDIEQLTHENTGPLRREQTPGPSIQWGDGTLSSDDDSEVRNRTQSPDLDEDIGVFIDLMDNADIHAPPAESNTSIEEDNHLSLLASRPAQAASEVSITTSGSPLIRTDREDNWFCEFWSR
ncbi:hypothetical protein BJ508DRAFT_337014 [Ascobolus immersus RN42]|uniref:Uncharacterized protein n=1 Tax=Ascobolus immersus RN42 TaxID=1160509 RepID=A0A3N4H6L8_ASCIM|nr:hypothetical protein BJ508DRAFT_337014 [Ascobolus immersus RN42]